MKILGFIMTVLSAVAAQITGWSLPILAVVNFAFLLFKDATLFPWIYLLWLLLAFLFSIVMIFVSATIFIIKD